MKILTNQNKYLYKMNYNDYNMKDANFFKLDNLEKKSALRIIFTH